MPFLEFFDETLDINSTENYELSVQISSNDLSFCILDTLRNKFVLLRSYEPEPIAGFDYNQLADIINKDDFLTRKYKKVSVIAPSPKSTLVPGPLFDDSKKNEYFTFNQIPSEGEIIMTNKLRDPDVVVVFSLPEGVVHTINSAFPVSTIMHPLKPLFQYINSNRRSIGINNVHVHLERDYLNLIIFDQNSLKFCNTFRYNAISDIQYYILYVLKRMNIRLEETIYFSGRITKEREILSSFSNYLDTIKFAVPEGNYTFSYVFNETELHKFLTIFSAVSCE
jgi:hypothetical protein